MGAPGIDVIKWGRERARAGPWRGDQHVALLTPIADAPIPSAVFVRRCIDTLASRGYRRVVTGALSPAESHGFLAAGFEISEQLHLLSHDLKDIPPPASGAHLRRGGRSDDDAVLEVDHEAFPPFWQLDSNGLQEAIRATAATRYRLAEKGSVIAYAVTGRSGRKGYVQRLAVHPDHRGQGLGATLVIDGLRWLKRWRAEQAVVNTQLDNGRALALYERLGFRRQPLGLSVLSAGIV